MGIVGILFGQTRSIIGVRDDSVANTFLSKNAQELSKSLVNQWSAGDSKVGIILDALVSEEPVFRADVTKNPVENGASISDHMQLLPVELTMEGVITDAPLGYAVVGNIQNLVRNVTNIFGGKSRSIDAFNELRNLQTTRQPFTVLTSLQRYKNMVMTELSPTRNSQTGNAIHFRCKMIQVNIVSSQLAQNLSDGVKGIGAKTTDVGNKTSGNSTRATTSKEYDAAIAIFPSLSGASVDVRPAQ